MMSFKVFLTEKASDLASAFHDEWRKEYNAKHNGNAPPRLKKTTDERWIKKHGKDEVDIASTEYKHLPKDWKAENHKAAKVAWGSVSKHKASGKRFTKNYIESASDHVHKQWLKRNGAHAGEHQKVDYKDLNDEEKEKDRKQVRSAIDAYRRANKRKRK